MVKDIVFRVLFRPGAAMTIGGLVALVSTLHAAEFNVATNGSDTNPGTKQAPLRTIQRAADLAQPGDVVTVHAGVYRERVSPPRGGTSDKRRIVYQAAPSEKVVITGSEIVKRWERVTNDTWTATIPNSFFGGFNPYADEIHGDWFHPNGRRHHTGAVYLNGHWLNEAAHKAAVLGAASRKPLWFGEVTNDVTTIWAQFPGANPNEQTVEINVRQTVFTPNKTGINYITVRGFKLCNAATPWAPPSAGQFGVISAYWCKGWIIEDNEISYSKCSGVALGKYGDEFDNTNDKGGADPYTDCVRRALTNGWNQATVGGHLVRNNHIHHCEQTGIVGSLGCSFSTITGNEIHDIHVEKLFAGYEQAGIKFHGAVDVTIRGNQIRCCGNHGVWLDWMCQGAQVTENFMHGNENDLFLEMQHGPMLVANNLFLSRGKSFNLNSQGIAFAHNLIAGPINNYVKDRRVTPFQKPHSTEFAGLYPAADGDSGDHRFYHNLLIAPGSLDVLDKSALPCFAAGNVFTAGARPSKFDADALVKTNFNPSVNLTQKSDGWYVTLTADKTWRDDVKRPLVTSELLGQAKVSACAYENADGSPITIATDYYGKKRNKRNPFPGPFERVGDGPTEFRVWPRDPAR